MIYTNSRKPTEEEKLKIAEMSGRRSTVGKAEKVDGKSRVLHPCIHLGNRVGESLCETCHGQVKIKTFECVVHGTATMSLKVKEAHGCCKDCNSYVEKKEPASTSIGLPEEEMK